MAKKKKGIAAAIEAAAKAAKSTATKAAVSSAAKQVKSTANKVAKKTGASTSSQSAAAVAAAKAAAEAAAKAAKQAAAKKAAAKTQEGLLKNTKALQTKKRGGVVLSNKTLQRKQAAQKARENALKYITKGTDKKSVKKAIQKGKKTSALGTEIKKVTKTYDTGAKTTNSIVTGASVVANIAKAPEEVSKLVSQGHSEEAARKAVNEAIKANVDATKVKLEKDNPSKIKYSYKNLTQGEYNLMAVAAQQGRLRELLQNNKTLANKVRKLNVKDYVDSPVVMGALDQLTQGLSVSQDPVYKYSKDEKRIMEKQKQTTGYNVGRVAGAVGEFALGGTSSMGSSLAKTAGKTALKEAAKQGGKSLAKTAAKNTAKDIGGDALASLGLNTLDALKFSYEDGKFNKKAFAKELALNVGGDMLLGGAVSGITHGLSANQVRRFNNINKKVINGADVSAVEMKFYNKHLDELIDKVSTKYEEVKEAPKQKPSSGNNIAEQRANELKAQGLSEDDVLETLASEGVSPVDALKALGDDIEENVVVVGNVNKARIDELKAQGLNDNEIWEKVASEAASNPGKTYNNAAEMIKGENPSPREALESSNKINPKEYPHVRQTAIKLRNQVEDDVAEIIEPWIKSGQLNKRVIQTQKEALEQAEKELADGTLFNRFMDGDVQTNEHLFMARAKVVLEDLMQKAVESDEASEMLLKAMDKATEAASHGGRLMNATKLLMRNTPQGRLRTIQKEVEKLNAKYGDRLKGGKLELSQEQITAILNATDDTITDVADKINREIWEDIPATWFEKFNEFRHTSMLFNAKTHARNMFGNSVFYQCRLISDGIEILINKMPAIKNKVEKLGGKPEMLHVTRKEITDNKAAIDKLFDANYSKSDSKNQFLERSRPDGVPIFKNKLLNKVSTVNYGALEWEDMQFFKPEYRKNFIRWCKANDVDLNTIQNLPKDKLRKADAYAMRKAEEATFRDDSAFARKIVKMKETTATKKGKTAVGTAAYRTANVILEGNLPFVKTPVNIMRRTIDYSPIGLLRSGVELATAKTADDFMQGVHHMSTGLTGTGVFAVGMWLANKDLITVKAGEVSGDAYYDRGMGYQDYSLVINIGGKEYSMTIDWLSPMQVSLFMGAATYNNLSEDGVTFTSMIEGLSAVTGPMLDMSYMSSTKDTVETFMEKVYRNGTGDDADWTGAIMQTLFGSVPQGYLNGFVPQLLSQTAMAFDSKQRDTRSTKEDPIEASWESFARKLVNKVPGLRNVMLNPKLEVAGEDAGKDVETGSNIVTRFLNAYVNPSNVKEIKTTKYDKRLIKIYNNLPDGSEEKKYFWHKFTGNPQYDLPNGKRMTYDEAYTYGKESRRRQTKLIQDMMRSKSYKNMTNEMKVSEIDGANWLGQTYADRKTYGDKFAVNRIAKNGFVGDARAANVAREIGIKDKDFLDFYITKERLVNRAHDSDWNTKALAVALNGNDKMAELYGVNIDKVDIAKEYLKNGGSEKEYSDASCNIASTIAKAQATTSASNKALAAAEHNITARTYPALGISDQKANMGVGLKNFGYDFNKLDAMKTALKYHGYDTDQSGSINKRELMAYIDSLGLDSWEEKACLFEYLKESNTKNPYGQIPNYLGLSNTSSSSGGGSRSYSRSSKTSKATTEKAQKSTLPPWEEYVKDYVSNVEKVSGVNFKDWDSPLDKTYVNKINSILKKTEV